MVGLCFQKASKAPGIGVLLRHVRPDTSFHLGRMQAMNNNQRPARVMVCDPKTSEVWECHWQTAIADIASSYQVSSAMAEEMLDKATINKPLPVQGNEFWLE